MLFATLRIIISSMVGYSIGHTIGKCINEGETVVTPTVIEEKIEVKLPADPIAFFNQSPEEGLIEALDYYEIQYPEIVYAQALLETGHFSSSVCKNYNNLFGLYNSRTKSYYRFDNWWDSVKAYKDFVQYKYKGNTDYYTFLVKLPYATDPNYIRKIKQLEHRYWAHNKE